MGLFGNLLGGILGGGSSIKTGKDNEKLIQSLRQEDQKFNTEQWDKAAQYNRPNQSSDFGSLTWSKDDKGNWTQTNTLNPAEQARLADFRQIAANRMGAAAGMSMTSPNINYNAFPSQAAANWKGPPPGALNQYDPFANFGNASGPAAGGGAVGGPAPQQGNPVMIPGPSGGGGMLGQNWPVTPQGPAPAPAPAPAAPAAPQQPGQDAIAEALRKFQEEQALAAWQQRDYQDSLTKGA